MATSSTACLSQGLMPSICRPTAERLLALSSAARDTGRPSAADTVRIVVVLPTEPTTATIRGRRPSVMRYARATNATAGHSRVE